MKSPAGEAKENINFIRNYIDGLVDCPNFPEDIIRNAKRSLKLALSNGEDVAGMEKALVKLERKARISYAYRQLNALQRFIEGKPTGFLTPEGMLESVKGAIYGSLLNGPDLAEIETQYLALVKSVRRLIASKELDELRNILSGKPSTHKNFTAATTYCEEAIEKARSSGTEVEDLEKDFLELKKSASGS